MFSNIFNILSWSDPKTKPLSQQIQDSLTIPAPCKENADQPNLGCVSLLWFALGLFGQQVRCCNQGESIIRFKQLIYFRFPNDGATISVLAIPVS